MQAIETVNYLGSLSTGALIGSVITLTIKHFFDKTKAKIERQSNLQKEIFFNLQKQAESIFLEINLLIKQTQQINFWLSKKIFTMELTNIDWRERNARLSSVQVYFSPDVLRKFDELAINFMEIADIYINAGTTSAITPEQIDAIKMFSENFMEKVHKCQEAIFAEVNKAREMIV